MGLPENIYKEVTKLTGELIEAGLCDVQSYPILRTVGHKTCEITFSEDHDLAYILKNIPYNEVYEEIKRNKSYNLYMADGGIIQIQYLVRDGEIIKHRLAFFPSPSLEEYQNNPDIYENDEIYADVLMKNVVTSPIRFDFDREAFVEGSHPMSHLTIGQYKNCRIPVGGPISPYLFLHFVLSSFYNTAYNKCSNSLTVFECSYSSTITTSEARNIHIMASFK
ncbi:hypothetical protein HNR00_003384 [Methylorubrum rhodinum]|uniref:DUF2290 domain-containing protein n=1 Tax=Methylorubrum rhodinum TaxID=29428 RepID=A0A840ZP34_9HYPH|nr:DUF2290 domain-containing protein [Methylorubrum rhodinum]MBB5758661.1 hypothetical protein [Methylorubrum rhodinum]